MCSTVENFTYFPKQFSLKFRLLKLKYRQEISKISPFFKKPYENFQKPYLFQAIFYKIPFYSGSYLHKFQVESRGGKAIDLPPSPTQMLKHF